MMRPNSLRARMTRGFALYSAALMLLVWVAFVLYVRHTERQSVDAILAQAAREIGDELRSGEHSLNHPAELTTEESHDLRTANIAVLIVDKAGRVVAQSQKQAPRWPPRDDSWRLTSFRSGTHTVVIGVPWAKTQREGRERALLLLGLSTLVVAASALGAWVLVGHTLSPIDRLARQAQAASTESLRVQLHASSPDVEITRLVATLNDLLARLGESAAMRGRFYAAASHELRTPLQALSGHLEVALSRPREAAQYRAALCESHAQAERLTSLVQDLLLLNQLDAGTARPPGVLLDLADICEGELSHLRPLADERGLHIELVLPDHAEMVAPWNHATMLIRNLLENAIKYATPGGTVRIRLHQSTLEVQNDCAPIEGWQPEKYFEPFFRPDASRNSQTGGNGLGLAICKAIADLNEWPLSLQPQASGICATVVFAGERNQFELR